MELRKDNDKDSGSIAEEYSSKEIENSDSEDHNPLAKDEDDKEYDTLDDMKGSDEDVIICEECENLQSSVYCKECEQYMCEDCNKKIHNKGARLKHRRIDKDKLEPFFLMTHMPEENEDSVPSLIPDQPLH